MIDYKEYYKIIDELKEGIQDKKDRVEELNYEITNIEHEIKDWKQHIKNLEYLSTTQILKGTKIKINLITCNDDDLLEWYNKQDNKILIVNEYDSDNNGVYIKDYNYRIDLNNIIIVDTIIEGYEQKALQYAEKYGMLEYDIVDNIMYYSEIHDENAEKKPRVYIYAVNLDTNENEFIGYGKGKYRYGVHKEFKSNHMRNWWTYVREPIKYWND